MAQTPREIVRSTLTFSYPHRLPVELWVLPWAEQHHPQELRRLLSDHPCDIVAAPDVYHPSRKVRGDMYGIGRYTDEWGCVFTGVQDGVIGEVRDPLLRDLADWRSVAPPYEILPVNRTGARDAVNRWCDVTERFVRSNCWPRPWERYQFLRGTENALTDVLLWSDDAHSLLRKIHEYYLRELEFWVSTSVDALSIMDDWGSQHQLLIPPAVWRELFKPLYRDYCAIAHAAGKFVFMHSDGNIQEILPDLIEVGVDAINAQLFCMDLHDVARVARERITFWGEIDRQHVLPSPDPSVGRSAVRHVAEHLYLPAGGIIVQFECGPGVNMETAEAVLDEWKKVERAQSPLHRLPHARAGAESPQHPAS